MDGITWFFCHLSHSFSPVRGVRGAVKMKKCGSALKESRQLKERTNQL